MNSNHTWPVVTILNLPNWSSTKNRGLDARAGASTAMLCAPQMQKSYSHPSRIPTLNSNSNYATLKVSYVEKERSQKAKLTESILRDMAHKVIQEHSRFM